jgi:rod shape-determining protein MreC
MIKDKLNYIIGGAFFVLLIGVFVFFSNPRNTQRVQAGFLGLIAPFLKQGSGLQKKYSGLREGLKTLEQLEGEVKRLRIANKELSATNQMLRGLELEVNQLRGSLGYREKSLFQLMPARIISRDASTWYQKIVIDRGKAELIEPDMPVLTPEGLVGKTTVVAEHSSQVVLIADENCRVSASVEGTRAQGIVKGERSTSPGLPAIGLGFLEKEAGISPGMNVFTSGVGGVFPYGVMIGKIKEFKKRELDGYATLVPAVDLSTIEDVFVVVAESK